MTTWGDLERSLLAGETSWLVRTFVALLILAPTHSMAFDVNDCILEGLRGVTSDRAAAYINKACLAKQEAYRQQQMQLLTQEYGESIRPDYVLVGDYVAESEGVGSVQVTFASEMAAKVLGYVALSVAVGGGGWCKFDFETNALETTYVYKLAVKPGGSARLIFPYKAGGACVQIAAARARKSTWREVSTSSPVKPLEKDPFADSVLFPPRPTPLPYTCRAGFSTAPSSMTKEETSSDLDA